MTEHRKAYLKVYRRQYYQKNKAYLIAKNVDWNRQNPTKRAAITERYRIKHYGSLKAYADATKSAQKARNLRHGHGISLLEYNKLFTQQNGLCLGCYLHQSQFKLSFAVDHDHKTGKVRGLLCSQCNTALGLLKDNSETLQRLIEYLARNK